MQKYTKPSIEIVELQIAENIAALVPKTIYKSSANNNKLTADNNVLFTDKNTFGDTSII